MGKLGAVIISLGLCSAISFSVLEAQTIEGILTWDGPCGRGEDGSRGVLVSGFEVAVRIDGATGNPGFVNLKPVFVPTRPVDPLGCETYEVELRTHYPEVFPLEIGDRCLTVLFQVKSIGSGGLQSQPAEHSPDLNCDCSQPFLRGDANQDGRIDISDAVCILNFMFAGDCPQLCSDAANFNGDLKFDISDAVCILSFLFSGGCQ